ncbi:hypothetical protein [Roseicella sp. DB1501]|uniref:hypothetical protein n=1 Tax=Roseicella sp. DB1501 TaxID=2730925 RepID=UPI0014930F81|nr:hypothetical protein [Roseicella sp. DB1501]NOG73714.1 hypothetical protein [Roseicella sp. DB1501]
MVSKANDQRNSGPAQPGPSETERQIADMFHTVTIGLRTIWDLPSEFWPKDAPSPKERQRKWGLDQKAALDKKMREEEAAIEDAFRRLARHCGGHDFYAEWLARVTPDHERGR